jgi:hypothetical protein
MEQENRLHEFPWNSMLLLQNHTEVVPWNSMLFVQNHTEVVRWNSMLLLQNHTEVEGDGGLYGFVAYLTTLLVTVDCSVE